MTTQKTARRRQFDAARLKREPLIADFGDGRVFEFPGDMGGVAWLELVTIQSEGRLTPRGLVDLVVGAERIEEISKQCMGAELQALVTWLFDEYAQSLVIGEGERDTGGDSGN